MVKCDNHRNCMVCVEQQTLVDRTFDDVSKSILFILQELMQLSYMTDKKLSADVPWTTQHDMATAHNDRFEDNLGIISPTHSRSVVALFPVGVTSKM